MAPAVHAWQVERRQRVKTTLVFTMADQADAERGAPWDTGEKYAPAASGLADVKSPRYVR